MTRGWADVSGAFEGGMGERRGMGVTGDGGRGRDFWDEAGRLDQFFGGCLKPHKRAHG